jgi:hypothetical protein
VHSRQKPSAVYAGKSRAAAQRVAAGATLVLAIAGAIAASPERQVQAVLFAGGLAAFVGILRVAAARVEVHPSGVVLQGPIRRMSFDWEDVSRFDSRPAAFPSDPPQAVVILEDGTELELPGQSVAFALLRPADPSTVRGTVASLNADMRSLRSTS